MGSAPAKLPRAVVLGVEHPRGVAVIRSLGRRGISVVAVERNASARGLWSRYVSDTLLVDDDPGQAVSALEHLGRNGGGVLIPTSDHFLMLVSRHFDRLSKDFIVTVPPWEVLEGVMDKPQCYRLGREAGLGTPRFFTPAEPAALDRVVASLDFSAHRYVLSVRLPDPRPVDPVTGRMTKAAGNDADTVRQNCLDIASRTGQLPMIIEVIPGRSDRCVGVSMMVNRLHEPVVAYCVRRLQLYLYSLDTGFIHPYELGANVYCESVRDDEAIEAATKFVRHAGFYGAITVEFRRDPTDGGLKLIKADPRMVRATSLSAALGLDIPAALYRAFTDGRIDVAPSYPEGVAWLWPTWYLETIWGNRARTPMAAELWALLKHGRRIKAFAYLDLRDPLPGMVDATRAARSWLRAGGRRALPSHSALGRLARAARRGLRPTAR
ncbi:MAG: hypothetical protein ACREKQ_12980 [Candidatus Rokuibacteriota bacterium]